MEPLRGGNLVRNIPPEVLEIWNESHVKRTPAEWGFRWVWNHPEVTVVISGMNEISQVDENIRTASGAYPNSLNEKELDTVRRAAEKYRKLMIIPCTGCRYCMPCPAGVDIPGCFELYNSSNIFKGRGEYDAQYMYLIHHMGVLGNRTSALLCVDCGRCKEHCPQHMVVQRYMIGVLKHLNVRRFLSVHFESVIPASFAGVFLHSTPLSSLYFNPPCPLQKLKCVQ